MTDDLTRGQLEDIVRWWTLLDELQSAVYSPGSNGRANYSGVRASDPDSAPMIAVIRLERIHHIRLHVELLAHEWGWQPGDEPYFRFLLARWPWARTHMPADHADRVTHIHRKLQQITREGPLPVDRVCPSCGTSQLAETIEGQLWCDTCQLVRDESELKALTSWRLIANEATVTRKDAAQILGESENVIKQRIRRRQVPYEIINGTRHYNLGDLK